jgi:hypothetical protein
METIMAAEQSRGSKANIKVEKQPNGQVRIVIEGLSIAGNMMDVEEGVLQYLNQAGTAIMKEALQQHDVEGDPLFCGLENGRAKGNTARPTKHISGKRK